MQSEVAVRLVVNQMLIKFKTLLIIYPVGKWVW